MSANLTVSGILALAIISEVTGSRQIFIKHWYNTKRLHSKNGYLSPLEKEDVYYHSLNPTSLAA